MIRADRATNPQVKRGFHLQERHHYRSYGFHTINADGQMFGYNYPPTGMGPSITADEPCATVENASALTAHEFTRA